MVGLTLLSRFQVKGQTNTAPGPPGWGLGVGPTSPPGKRFNVAETSNTDTLMQQPKVGCIGLQWLKAYMYAPHVANGLSK